MSVFEGANNQNAETAEATQDQTNQSFVQKLAEAKGDKWRDPEVIAKGKIDADAYIEQLKTQVEELRKLAERGAKVEDLVAKLDQKAAQTTSANSQASNPGGATATDTKSAISEEDIQSLVEKTLNQRETKQTLDQNINQVDQQLKEMFGTEAGSKLKEKSTQLGLSLEELKNVASKSPTAFFTLIGEQPKEFRPMTSGSIRTEGVSNQQSAGTRNNSYYQKMRKENPRLFNQSQQQMVQDRARLGDAFYK